jgi:dynein assembly factor with WDR repeat domains 1
MRLKRLLLRYYPPGLILESQHKSGDVRTKVVDLFDMPPNEADVESFASLLLRKESPLLSERHKPVVMKLIIRLMEKQRVPMDLRFELLKIQQTHILPMTNLAWNKDGSQFVSGSYDRTCKVWNTWPSPNAEPSVVLDGVHSNVVYAVSFNNPFSDRIITGSFDNKAVIWDVKSGDPLAELTGHTSEIVCVCFSPNGRHCATGSMDSTAKIFDVDSGRLLHTLSGHSGEIVSLEFSSDSSKIVSGSFDTTARIWEVSLGSCISVLSGHQGEISCCHFSFVSDVCATSSIDGTCRLWDVLSGDCLDVLQGHSDEILDISFNFIGSRLASASSDTTARVYNTRTGACVAILSGHQGEVCKVAFSANGALLATASTDRTCRVWSVTGECIQIIDGHAQELFSCGFNYEADLLFTASKDNTVRIYQARASSVKSSTRPRALSSLDSIGTPIGLEDAAYRLRASDDFS